MFTSGACWLANFWQLSQRDIRRQHSNFRGTRPAGRVQAFFLSQRGERERERARRLQYGGVWCTVSNEDFMEEVARYECFYSRNSKDFKDKNKKANSWKKVREKFNLSWFRAVFNWVSKVIR